MADTKGVFTPGAETAWKLIVLLLVVAGAGFEGARFMAGSEAKAAVVAPAPVSTLPADIVQRLDRIEQAQAQAAQAASTLATDVAVIRSQVQDLREHRR
jgi:hypothetical protein